jgi:hypothetical protein
MQGVRIEPVSVAGVAGGGRVAAGMRVEVFRGWSSHAAQPEDLDVSDATFVRPDLTTFCRLAELGLVVVGQHLEFALVRTLASDPTRVFTKDELLRTIWGFRAPGEHEDAGLARVPAAPQARPGRRPLRVNVWELPRRPQGPKRPSLLALHQCVSSCP